MITLPSMLAIKAFFKSAWPFMLAAAVGLILLLTYCEGKKSGRAGADLAISLHGGARGADLRRKRPGGAAAPRADRLFRRTANSHCRSQCGSAEPDPRRGGAAALGEWS